jgi:hypothetical protein
MSDRDRSERDRVVMTRIGAVAPLARAGRGRGLQITLRLFQDYRQGEAVPAVRHPLGEAEGGLPRPGAAGVRLPPRQEARTNRQHALDPTPSKDAEWSCIRRDLEGREELFRLSEDPNEQRNLAEDSGV